MNEALKKEPQENVQNIVSQHRTAVAAPQNVTKMLKRALIPLTIMLLVMAELVVFQTVQVVKQRISLNSTYDSQVLALNEVRLVKKQLSTIAKNTYDLAQNGNPHAVAIVAKMKKAGFSFSDKH